MCVQEKQSLIFLISFSRDLSRRHLLTPINLEAHIQWYKPPPSAATAANEIPRCCKPLLESAPHSMLATPAKVSFVLNEGRIVVFRLSLHVIAMCGCINTLSILPLLIFYVDGETYLVQDFVIQFFFHKYRRCMCCNSWPCKFTNVGSAQLKCKSFEKLN